MLSSRLTSISENPVGEPEQDANSALTELDKGLRSQKIGEQCEAIVRFPKLFEKYPFPILINSSFLKLADVFRVGNNFLRIWVLRVCQQSEKHLDKILNVDEFVRRIYSVIHSNDPVARAFTLRTLGSVAAIIPEREQVHHSIRSSLDSHDSVEIEAAIYAAMQFAAQSKLFAVSMCNKIWDMIQGLNTPASMKLKLIPILQHMHHDTATAAMVRSVCTDLLPKYPAQDFVIVTLKTLTQLATATLVDIAPQVKLLLSYLHDPRSSVRYSALSCLHVLAKKGAHYWPEEAVLMLIEATREIQNKKLTSYVLDVLIVLSQSSAICHAHHHQDSTLMQLCHEVCYYQETTITAKAVKIISQIYCYCYEQGLPVGEEDIDHVESLLLLTCCDPTSEKGLVSCLESVVLLCRKVPHTRIKFAELILSQIVHEEGNLNPHLCKALVSIGGLQSGILCNFLTDILNLLRKPNLQPHIKTMLCTLIFQTKAGQPIEEGIEFETVAWEAYRVARSAAKYGHFDVSAKIFKAQRDIISSEHLHFWLASLEQLSLGEAVLKADSENIKTLDRFGAAVAHYCKAMAAFKAASTPTQTLTFQSEYVALRCEMLQNLSQLYATCNTIQTVPPPAIAQTLIQNNREDLLRFGHIVNQLRKRAKELRSCGENYWKLYQTAFDADPISLLNIQLCQHFCVLLAHNVEAAVLPNQQSDDPVLDPSLLKEKNNNLGVQMMAQACHQISSIAKSVPTKPLTFEYILCLQRQVEHLISSPFCYPRFFFQVLQSTSVKLAVSPQPRVSGEWLTVVNGSQLTIKVEGVIQHGRIPSLFRSIQNISITVTSQLTSRNPSAADSKVHDTGSTLNQILTPHHDFFTGEFLLGFPCGGQFTVTAEAAVIDQLGGLWHTGPKSTFNVKVHEDNVPSRPRTAL